MDLQAMRALSTEDQDRVLQELEDFLNELNARTLEDSWCLECAADMGDRTPAYEAIYKTLTPKQQEDLDLYISACEELERSLAFVAYIMGREHERKGIPPARLLFSNRNT